MFASSYRKLLDIEPTRSGEDVILKAGERQIRMSADDYRLAQLFDGAHSREQVLQRARAELGRDISMAMLERLAAELAVYGLLQPGRQDPLPPPGQRQPAPLDNSADWPAIHAFPPTTVPGSLAQPATFSSLHGTPGPRLGEPPAIGHPLPLGPFLALGRLLAWPLQSTSRLISLLGLTCATLLLVFAHRHEWTAFSIFHLPGWRMVGALLIAAWLVNLVSMSARAAAIVRYAGARPALGLAFAFPGIPHLRVEAFDVAAHLHRSDRLRIVGAGIIGTMWLLPLGALTWFLTATTNPNLAGVGAISATAASISLALRLNPLLVRDGYQLLSNALSVLDLRRQSIAAVFGMQRPWPTHWRRLPRRWLAAYGALALLFTLAAAIIIFWVLGMVLEHRFQGTGIVLLLTAWGAFMVRQFSRVSTESTALGEPKKSWRPSRRQWTILAAIAAISLIPYPYAPGGKFEVLPRDRADVRALTAGDVREVLVSEGDTVTAGQTIVRIDDTGTRARVAAAEAQLASLEADLALTRKGAKAEEIELAQQRVATAQATTDLARANFRRIAQAYRGRSVTAQEYDLARGQAEVSERELNEAQQRLALVTSPAEAERIQGLQADIRQVQAELDAARSELAATRITAPIAGRVVSRDLQFARGNYLERGEMIATIQDTGELLGEVLLPETAIGDIAPEAGIKAKLWAFPGSSFDGSVRSIAPNAEDGEYGRVVRVQVVLHDPGQKLKPGMTGNAKVNAGWHPTGIVFTRAFSRFFLVELWSWIP